MIKSDFKQGLLSNTGFTMLAAQSILTEAQDSMKGKDKGLSEPAARTALVAGVALIGITLASLAQALIADMDVSLVVTGDDAIDLNGKLNRGRGPRPL